MSPSRRDFLKYTGAAGLVIASSDLVGELIAQSPKGNPLTSTFKGLADVALGEAKRAGCSYADIRFTRSVSTRRQRQRRQRPRRGAAAVRRRRARRRTGRRRRRRAPAAGRARRALASASFTAASGASPAARSSARTRSSGSPASPPKSPRPARSRRKWTSSSRRCRPTPSTGRRRSRKSPARSPPRTSRRSCRRSSTPRVKVKGVTQRHRDGRHHQRVEVLRLDRRLLHRAGNVRDHAVLQRLRESRRRHEDPQLRRRAEDRRLGGRRREPRCSRTPSASPTKRSR